jgi:hypothetical protein
MRGLVERGERAPAGGEGHGGRRVFGGGDQGVEAVDAVAQVGRAGGLRPFVLQPGAGLAVPVGVVEIAHDRTERDGGATRDHRVGSEGLPQRPHRGAQARPRMRAVGPEPVGQRVTVVRPGVQRQERQQPQVQRRQRHRHAVALDGDLTEELHRQHPMTVPGLTLT